MNTIENKVAAVPSLKELSLVRAAKQGDDAAFERAGSAYDRNVFRIAQHITQNREDAEDVVQEAFLKAYGNLAKFQEQSKILYLLVADRGKRSVDESFAAAAPSALYRWMRISRPKMILFPARSRIGAPIPKTAL